MPRKTLKDKGVIFDGAKNASKKIFGLLYRVSSIVVICEMLIKHQGKIDKITKEMSKDANAISEFSEAITNFPVLSEADKEKTHALLMMISDQIDRLKITILGGGK